MLTLGGVVVDFGMGHVVLEFCGMGGFGRRRVVMLAALGFVYFLRQLISARLLLSCLFSAWMRFRRMFGGQFFYRTIYG